MLDFSGQTAIVAGGCGGIGRATAERFEAQGADVWVADLQPATGSGSSAPGRFLAVDMTDAAAVGTCVDEVVASTGRLDVAVNAVGWTANQPFAEDDEEYWRRILDVNLLSTVLLVRAASAPMRAAGYGRIVAVSSLVARVGEARSSVYAAAKAGVIAFAKSQARELASSGITVNSVAPGAVETSLFSSQGERLAEATRRAVPLGRISDPSEQAAAIVFLASREAGYITGQTLSVDGGLSMI